MPIIRGKLGLVDNFTQIPNNWLRDSNLSLKSIGLLAQLSSHEEGWKVTIGSLAKANECGHDYIRGAVNELEEAGYLRREQRRSANNQFAEVIWITQDPSSGSPLSEKPSSGKPISENPTLKNTNNKKTNNKNTIDKLFARFWEAYPRKVGRGKAESAFSKALKASLTGSGEVAEQIIAGAIKLASDPNLPDKQFIPYPATWLAREGWHDEPYPPRELSEDEKRDKAIAESRERAEREREHTRRMLEQYKTPEPFEIAKCDHGKTVALCVVCSKKLATE